MTYKTKNPNLFSRFFLEVNFEELEAAREKAEETLGPVQEIKVVFYIKNTDTGDIEKMVPESTYFSNIKSYEFVHNLTDSQRELRVLLDS